MPGTQTTGTASDAGQTPLAKALARDNRGRPWTRETFEELLDVVYWLRVLLGMACGVAWGVLPLEGVVGFAVYTLLSTAVVFLFVTRYVIVDVDSYGGEWALVSEAFMPAGAIFLLCWIVTFTALHGDLEE